jgi:hypothetical protein
MTVLLLENQSSLQPHFDVSQQCTCTRVTELVEVYVECHCPHPDALGTTAAAGETVVLSLLSQGKAEDIAA